MRIQRPVGAGLALQSKLLAVRRQQQFNRGGIKANSVIQNLRVVLGVNRLHGQHGHENAQVVDQSRVSRKERLEMKRLRALNDEVDPFGGNIDPLHLIYELIDLDDDDGSAKRCGLD